MRTTVTLDPDTEALLRSAMQQTGENFKVTLNRAIRKGLVDIVPETKQEPFIVEAKAMGLKPGIDYSKINQLNDELEIEAYLEVTRKLEERRASSKK